MPLRAPAWIAELNKLRQPYNVNALTQAAVVALLADTAWIAEQAAADSAPSVRRLEAELARLRGRDGVSRRGRISWLSALPTRTECSRD